jgi:predicted  nucleic acid-binding Zn-ribbon protein
MPIHPVTRRFSAALKSLLPATSPRGQTPEASPSRLQKEIVEVRAENAAIRDELRKLEERQKMLLQLAKGLQRRVTDRETNRAD